jgi:diketogulonate reductase-like aldo/keto reductase
MTRPLAHDTVQLTSGASMPLLGFGTWQLEGEVARDAVSAALEAGYRHLDTATIYGNEREVGTALRDSGIPREDVFITTKCPPQNAERELETLRESLDLLGTDQVDLWLIHWPARGGTVDMWRAFIEAQEQGLVRNIGVSNFDARQLDEVTDATGVRPAVNQIEWSPLLFDATVVEEHRSRDVVLEGYSALQGGTLDHPVVVEVARRHGRSTAQVIVRWHLQHDIVVIPRSSKAERIRENAQVDDFELAADDMAALDALGTPG